MKQQNYKLLNELLEEFIQERNKIQDNIKSNLYRIEEIGIYLDMLHSNEDGNKVFSPRRKNLQQEDKKRTYDLEKESYLEDNEKQYKAVEQMDNTINLLRYILNSEKGEGGIRKFSNSFQQDSSEDNQQKNRLSTLEIREDERKRIAADLHDITLRNLAHLIHKLELSSLYIDNSPQRAKREIMEARENLRGNVEEIREIIYHLRPVAFNEYSMSEMIETLIKKLNVLNHFDVQYDIEDIECDDDIFLITIYKIIQECIYNAMEHSNGDQLSFTLKETEGAYKIITIDNGGGFDPKKTEGNKNFGLSMMKERVELLGGKVYISSDKNGTNVTITIPLK